jgi:endonuclease/exonuclease/phosphatase family metal-dependent hydrolase
MKLLSWNVNGRVQAALRSQLDKLLTRTADIVALQEVTPETYVAWCEGLMGEHYSVVSTADLLALPYPDPTIERRYMNLIAARHPLALLPGLSFDTPDQARIAFPEKYVVTRVTVDGIAIDVHNAHLVPGSTQGIIKVHMFEAIRRRLDEPTTSPRILCGDFNTPRSEDDTSVTKWARNDPRWDRAERSVLEHPELRDVHRELRQAGEPFPASHFTGGTPRRYDHIYAPRDLLPTACEYLSGWLDSGLSDHAPVEAQFALPARELNRPRKPG